MKEMSFTCVHRRGALVVFASGTPFYGQSIEDLSQSEATVEEITQQLPKLTMPSS